MRQDRFIEVQRSVRQVRFIEVQRSVRQVRFIEVQRAVRQVRFIEVQRAVEKLYKFECLSTAPTWPVLLYFAYTFCILFRPHHSKSHIIQAGTACTVHAFSRIVQSGLSSVESTQPGKITVR